MPEPYPVELVTPEGVAFEGDAEMVVVPGSAGQLGVLAHHAPLVSLLDPGETRITDGEGQVRRFVTDSGYLQVRKNRAIVLVAEAVDAGGIDAAEATARLERARAALERAEGGDGDVHAARREVGFAEALEKSAHA